MAASRNKRSPDLLACVARFLGEHAPGSPALTVALSGGRDSIVLADLVRQLVPAGRLSAIHVHHGLSPRADAWADFCANWCVDRNIPLKIARVQVEASGQGLEAAAREARYAAFADMGGQTILLGHHRQDQAETVLFNALRGAGVAGLAGMRAERQHAGLRFLRPLLDVSRTAITAYADAKGLRWIEDESNADRRFRRNFLRHEVLTALTPVFPAAEAVLARSAQHFSEAQDLLDDLAAMDWPAVCTPEGAAHLKALQALSVPRIKNLLRWRLRQLGWQVPVGDRLAEFVRQLCTAGPDRHPALALPQGKMVVSGRALHWKSHE